MNGYEIESLLKGSELTVIEDLGRDRYILYDKIARRKAFLKVGESSKIENEAAILEKCRGSGVPKLYFCFSRGGRSALLREYIEGRTLRETIEQDGCFSEARTAEIGVQICEILKRLHGCKPKVIHRDIKTENVVLSPEGGAFLVDYDISREYNFTSSRDTRVLGTPDISPPEQFGYSQTDERSDIYAAGVLLCEMAYGTVRPDSAPLKGRLGRAIRRCTGFDPQARYQSADELMNALKKICHKKVNKLKVLASAAAVLLCICIGAGAAVLAQKLPTYAAENYTSPDDIYRFKDPGIEWLVRTILSKDSGVVTVGDLSEITEISVVGDKQYCSWDNCLTHGNLISVGGADVTEYGQIRSLEDVKYMPNLRTLMVCNQEITDLSPLRGSGIVSLSIHGNSVRDLSPLSECMSLSRLSLSANPIDDLSPLEDLPNLAELDLGATDISSLKSCAKMRSLTNLQLEDCLLLDDYAALPELKKLTYLTIRPCPDEALDEILSMTNLTYLYMWQASRVTDLSQLSPLNGLIYLGVDGGRLESLEGVENFTRLDSLAIRNNYVSDLSPLNDLSGIKYLSLSGNPITDFEPIKGLDQLILLNLDSEQAKHAEGLREDLQVVTEW